MDTGRTRGSWATGLKISLSYAVFGLLWIAYSDRFLESISSDPGFITRMQTYKGWAYVLVTAALVLFLVRHYVVRLLRSIAMLREARDAAHRAAREAEDANQAKSVFLANVSHEIRTPMNAILGFAHILEGQVREPRQQELLASIQASGNSLIGLLTDILDLARTQSGGQSLEEAPVAIQKLSTDLEGAFRSRAAEKGLSFGVELEAGFPGAVVADEAKLRRVLDNLLDNAVKFTERGGVRVAFRASPLEGDDRRLTVTVEVGDTGPGIPEEQIQRIFEAFTQSKGQSINEFGGTGLGLALAQALAEEMGGRLEVDSEVGAGSTFRLVLDGVQATEVVAHVDEVPDSPSGKPIDEADAWDAADLSDAARQGLPELIVELEGMSGVCEDLVRTLTINDVEEFATRVTQHGEAYGVPPVAQWGQRLSEQAATFDLDGMASTLRGFTVLVDMVRGLQKA